MPASKRSSRLKRNDACRLVATSPGAVLRLPFLAIPGRRVEIDPTPGCVDPAHHDAHRAAQPHPPPGLGADQHRALLVELPPVPAEPAHGQQPLVAVAEVHEGPRADEADHLAIELALLLALEQEAARDVVGVALD